jgi:hypothetical protein
MITTFRNPAGRKGKGFNSIIFLGGMTSARHISSVEPKGRSNE